VIWFAEAYLFDGLIPVLVGRTNLKPETVKPGTGLFPVLVGCILTAILVSLDHSSSTKKMVVPSCSVTACFRGCGTKDGDGLTEIELPLAPVVKLQ
jgi:hypothetical protein